MRLGIAHHFGWAVAVTATEDHRVVDRRRIELIEPGVPTAPVHHEGKDLDDDGAQALVATVRESSLKAAAASLDELTGALPEPIVSISLRSWPSSFPTDIATQRRMPYEARADSVMYLQVLAQRARERGWTVHAFDAKTVESEAAALLGYDGQVASIGRKSLRQDMAARVNARNAKNAEIRARDPAPRRCHSVQPA